jgi:hypothetical protein
MDQGQISKAVMVNMTPVVDMKDAALARLPETLSKAERQEAEKEIDLRLIGRLQRRNLWTCQVAKENPRLIPFIGLDPIMSPELMRSEILDKVKNHGAKGIKLQSAAQRFYPYDPRLWLAYETAVELGLPLVFHSGGIGPLSKFALPQLFAQVASAFPKLTIVLAHLGLGYWDQTIALAKSCLSVNFDCSAAVGITEAEGGLSDDDLVSMIREIGVERVMFGSDYHWFDPIQSIERFLRLDFGKKEKRLMLGENAARIYRIS